MNKNLIEQCSSVISDYLNGKPMFTMIRRILNFLFSVSISSFLFEQFYYRYTIADVTDYKMILRFFVQGHFFIPFCLFITVYFVFDFCVAGITSFLAMRQTLKALKPIINSEVAQEETDLVIKAINDQKILPFPLEINKPVLLELYDHVKTEIPNDFEKTIRSSFDEYKQVVQQNICFLCKSLTVVSIYFISLSYIGWFFYLVTTVALVASIVMLFFSYIGLELAPAILAKGLAALEVYLNLHERGPNPLSGGCLKHNSLQFN